MSSNEPSLPQGWIKEFDPNTQRHFYVDTQANPPRSIWVHPLEDEQYLKEHPKHKNDLAPPAYDEATRRHSWNGESSQSPKPGSSADISKKRGFLGKMKDKMIGTKEEREAERRYMEQLRAQRLEQRRAAQAMYGSYSQYGHGHPSFQAYGQHSGYGYQPPSGIYPAQNVYSQPRRRGAGGLALPLAGGLAGGLILGDLLDGGFDDHDYGGGDFDGGGFDGGGFSDF